MKKTLFVIWPRTRHSAAMRYGVTLGIVGVAFLIRVAAGELLDFTPLLLFIPAILLASILFGMPLGVVATLASDVLAAKYLLRTDPSGLHVASTFVSLALFTAVGYVISVTIEKLHIAIRDMANGEAEKSLLLEELNHRTRNDLMLVSSALSLQARTATEQPVRIGLEAAVNRIRVISQAQERLGTTAGHRGLIELGTYLRALCDGLAELLRDVRPIALRVTTPELEVPSNQAVGIGLIVNELVTNALKHAFPHDMGGAIDVRISTPDEGLLVVVEDDGVGCQEETASGLGSRLVRLLASQYEGTMERRPGKRGCSVSVLLRSIKFEP